MRGWKEEEGEKRTFGKATTDGENGLERAPKHQGFLSAVEICETAEEEEETARAEGEGGDKPLELVW